MLRVLCAFLIVAALGLFFYRAFVLEFPLTPDRNSPVWSFEIQADLEESEDGGRISIFVPPESGRFEPVGERFISERMSLTVRNAADGNRTAIWSTAELEEPTSVYYRARLHRRLLVAEDAPQTLGPDDLPSDFAFSASRSAEQVTLANRLSEALDQDAYDTDTMTSLLIEWLGNDSDTLTEQLLEDGRSATSIAEAAAYVLTRHGTPARAVHGIRLAATETAVSPTAWLEVWTGKEWTSYDVETGDPASMDGMLALWRGDGALVTHEGAPVNNVRLALTSLSIGSVQALEERVKGSDTVPVMATLLDLPVNTQLVVRALLVIPLGVLVLVFLRQFVGVPTFGTFMPVLIALAFNTTNLATGLIILAIILGSGMTVRFFFSKLNLLLVPRLAAMLVVVILVMILVSVAADSFALGTGFSVTLFPIVILTMTIERLSVTWEENGPLEATKEFAGSIVVAVAAYYAMRIELLQHLLFIFPELLLLILAILLLMGRYAGFRLTELRRFHALSRQN